MDDLGDDVVAAAHQVQHLEVVQRVRGESAEEARHPVMAAARREVIEMRALPEVVFPVGVPRHVRSEQGEQCRDVPTAGRLIGSADDSDTCRSAIRSRGNGVAGSVLTAHLLAETRRAADNVPPSPQPDADSLSAGHCRAGTPTTLLPLGVIAGAPPVHDHDRLVADHPRVVPDRECGHVTGVGLELCAVGHDDVQDT
jgi:hypothetical protein